MKIYLSAMFCSIFAGILCQSDFEHNLLKPTCMENCGYDPCEGLCPQSTLAVQYTCLRFCDKCNATCAGIQMGWNDLPIGIVSVG